LSKFEGSKNNEIRDQQLLISTTLLTNKNQKFSFGYNLINYNIEFRILEDLRSSRRDPEFKGQSSSNLHSAYVSFINPINNKVGLDVGLRTSFLDISKKYYLEPRIRFSYKVNQVFNLSANYGRHSQFVAQVSTFKGSENGLNLPIWALAEEMSVPVQEAQVYQIGALYKKNSWTIDLQIYAKSVNGLSSRSYDLEMVQVDNPEIGSSETQGMDLLIKKRFGKFHSWLSYTYSETNLAFKRVLKKEFAANHDQRHIAEWTAQYQQNNFQLGLGIKMSSGLPYSFANDFRITSEQNEAFEYELRYTGINDRRLDFTQEINLSGQYKIKTSVRWTGYLGFSISNLLNRENVYDRSFFVNPPVINQMSRPLPLDKVNLPITTNFSFRIEW